MPGEQIKADRGTLVNIHYIERTVQGSGIGIKVYGQMKIACGELVYARELKLNTINVLILTPEVSYTGDGYITHAYIANKGQYDNYASIDVFDDAGNPMVPGSAPTDGSIWLHFIAMGE